MERQIDSALAWVEEKMGGTIVRRVEQRRWRPQWFIDVRTGDGRILPLLGQQQWQPQSRHVVPPFIWAVSPFYPAAGGWASFGRRGRRARFRRGSWLTRTGGKLS